MRAFAERQVSKSSPAAARARIAAAGAIAANNSFNIYDAALSRTVGHGLYLAAAMLNHSCDPNCSVSFHGAPPAPSLGSARRNWAHRRRWCSRERSSWKHAVHLLWCPMRLSGSAQRGSPLEIPFCTACCKADSLNRCCKAQRRQQRWHVFNECIWTNWGSLRVPAAVATGARAGSVMCR